MTLLGNLFFSKLSALFIIKDIRQTPNDEALKKCIVYSYDYPLPFTDSSTFHFLKISHIKLWVLLNRFFLSLIYAGFCCVGSLIFLTELQCLLPAIIINNKLFLLKLVLGNEFRW